MDLKDFIYQRLVQNKPFDLLYNPYSQETLKDLLFHYEKTEEYEKCQIIYKFI